VKKNPELALAMLVGVSIGVLGAEVIHAQQTKVAPGYVIAEVEVKDPANMQKYGNRCRQRLRLSITTLWYSEASRNLWRANRPSTS